MKRQIFIYDSSDFTAIRMQDLKKNPQTDLQLKNETPTKEGSGGKSRDLLCILCPVLPTIESFYDNAFPRKTTTRYCSRQVQ